MYFLNYKISVGLSLAEVLYLKNCHKIEIEKFAVIMNNGRTLKMAHI